MNSSAKRSRGAGRKVILAVVALSFLAPPASAQPTALVGATVYPVTSAPIENGVVLIEGDKIVAVGRDLTLPAGTRVIDVRGKVLTPGFINASAQVGLIEIGSETVDSRVSDDDLSAGLSLVDAVNPASQLIPVTRAGGITVVVSVPTGGLISGQAIALRLMGDTVEEMTVRAPAAIVGRVNRSARSFGGGSTAGVFGKLETLFEDAIAFRDGTSDYDMRRMRDLSASRKDLEALQDVLTRKIPLLLTANRRSDIEAALRFADKYNIRLLIGGGKEAWLASEAIAAAGVTVIIDPLENIPSYDALQTRLDNAAFLVRAGIPVAFFVQEEYNPRLLRQQAGNAVGHGMPWEQALRAVTINPATAFDLQNERGSLEPGKTADLVVWSGDPFELSTVAVNVIISGKEVPTRSRQTLLMEKYRDMLLRGN